MLRVTLYNRLIKSRHTNQDKKMYRHATDSATLRQDLLLNGIKEPMWQGFQWSVKGGGEHIRMSKVGDATFKLSIKPECTGYKWKLSRI